MVRPWREADGRYSHLSSRSNSFLLRESFCTILSDFPKVVELFGEFHLGVSFRKCLRIFFIQNCSVRHFQVYSRKVVS